MATTVGAALMQALRGHGCRVYSSDLRLRTSKTNRATYPDVTVVCGPSSFHPEDPHAVTNPTLLVEVLSEGTEASDRGDKWHHYRRLGSLQTYVLVDSRQVRVEVFQRDNDGWRLTEAGPEAGQAQSVALGLHAASLSVDAFYEGREATVTSSL